MSQVFKIGNSVLKNGTNVMKVRNNYFNSINVYSGFNRILGLIFDPVIANNRIFMCCANGSNITVADATTFQIIQVITGFGLPRHIALDTANNRGFVSDTFGTCVWVIDLTSLSITGKISGFADPVGLAVDTVNNRLLVMDDTSGGILVVDISNSSFPIIKLIALPSAFVIAIDPIASNNRAIACVGANNVAIIDLYNMAVTSTMVLGSGNVEDITFYPDGSKIVIASTSGAFYKMDAGSLGVIFTGQALSNNCQGVSVDPNPLNNRFILSIDNEYVVSVTPILI